MINILLAILVLSIIIIIHEFGHFIVAKANGVTVVEFSLGFGPKLLHFKKGDTEYCIKLLPFGGSCMMLGDEFLEMSKDMGEDDSDSDDDSMDDDGQNSKEHVSARMNKNVDQAVDDSDTVNRVEYDNAADDEVDDDDEDDSDGCGIKVATTVSLSDGTEMVKSDTKVKKKEKSQTLSEGYDMSKSFANQSVWARIAIIAAGPVFNFILAFVLAVVIIGCIGYDPCVVDQVYDNSPATEAGLQEGDKIVNVNGTKITFDRGYRFYRLYHSAQTMDITYIRDGQKYKTTLVPEHTKTSSYKVGIQIMTDCSVAAVTKNSPAAKGGLKKGDVIKSVDGETLANSTDFSEKVTAKQDQEITLEVSRDGKNVTLNVTPELVETEAYYTGFLDYGARVKTTPLETIGYSFEEIGYWIKTVVQSVGMMFSGKLGINDLSGPVGTVSVMSDVVSESKAEGGFSLMINLFNMGLVISANLGVMNLLPIPAIDGGRLVFLLIEAVRGKPVKKEREGMVHFVGMVLLMLLMIYVLFKDIAGLF